MESPGVNYHVANKSCSHYYKTAQTCGPLLQEFKKNSLNVDVLRHPSCSYHMTTHNLHLFRYLPHFMAETFIIDDEEVKTYLKQCFASPNCDL